MELFTPLPALAGGVLIGAAALLLLLGAGRIAGISGILSGVMLRPWSERGWRLLFVAGLIAGGWLGFTWLDLPAPQLNLADWPVLAIAGFLVGVGARLGNGCTSGHGICGIGRLSVRSIVATLVFMTTGALTVFVVNHLLV
ncbi:YeeE/YedE family protein [Pseudaeromonas sharmana]|uniref:YeeE/YedE family protein n=1 Tax=Pseudaeromonas sharmana TaxID=328412 RepID=A0ABV8CJR1_9GAMM